MSHAMRQYDLGDAVRCTAAFRSLSGVLFDPTTVSVSVRKPDGTITTKVYGTDLEVIKVSVGSYYIDVDGNAPGNWFYRWFSTGTGQAAAERAFGIRQSQFD
jgi:hypothetical protein